VLGNCHIASLFGFFCAVQGAETVRRLIPGVVSVFIVAESEDTYDIEGSSAKKTLLGNCHIASLSMPLCLAGCRDCAPADAWCDSVLIVAESVEHMTSAQKPSW
jgi:hypothetical protein